MLLSGVLVLMSGPKPAGIELALAERSALEAVVRAGTSAQQLVWRARIILAAADGMTSRPSE
jgi:hypothetical protein